jgi:Type II secretion system (T2SS), protein N
MIRPWHIIVFVFVLAAGILAFAPARLFLNPQPGNFVWRDVEGTIWQPTLRGARVGELDAGDIRLAISFTDLLFGRVVTDADLAGADIQGRARLQKGPGGEVRVTSPSLTISGAPLRGFGRLPGSTRLSNIDITLSDRSCRSAQGEIESDALARASESFGNSGPHLAGVVTCEGAVARLAMSGQRDGDVVKALLDLSNNGTGLWSVTYTTDKPEMAATLVAAGIAPETQAGVFASRGTVKWLPF